MDSDEKLDIDRIPITQDSDMQVVLAQIMADNGLDSLSDARRYLIEQIDHARRLKLSEGKTVVFGSTTVISNSLPVEKRVTLKTSNPHRRFCKPVENEIDIREQRVVPARGSREITFILRKLRENNWKVPLTRDAILNNPLFSRYGNEPVRRKKRVYSRVHEIRYRYGPRGSSGS